MRRQIPEADRATMRVQLWAEGREGRGVPIRVERRAFLYGGHVVGRLGPLSHALVIQGPPRLMLTSGCDPETLSAFAQLLRATYEPVLADARRVCGSLRRAGFDVTLERDGIFLKGTSIWALTKGSPSLDGIKALNSPKLLEVACEANLAAGADPLRFLVEPQRVAVLTAQGVRVAHVELERAVAADAVVVGDFLTPGRHWNALGGAIRAAADQAMRLEAERPRSVGDALGGVDERLRMLSMAASRDIRTRRSVAYPQPATLATGRLTLTFSPIDREAGRLIVPFRYSRGQAADGYLEIGGSSDPLPLYLGGDWSALDVGLIHATALLGFAALTVIPAQDVVSRRRAQMTSGRAGHTRVMLEPLQSKPGKSRRRYLNPALTPTGRTARAHWVAGHVRELSPGWHASEDAQGAAESVGIYLPENHTWVRPHFRGFQVDDELTFEWEAPSELPTY